MTNHNILIAGFGGQGIQFAGKLLAFVGMYTGREVSLIPSYGPEMRGGTSNCGVNISDKPIASPLVVTPTELIAMNQPSLDRFEPDMLQGSSIFYDTTLVLRPPARSDVQNFAIPATQMAADNGIARLGSVIMCGALLKTTDLCDLESARPIIEKLTPPARPELFELNMKALTLGFEI